MIEISAKLTRGSVYFTNETLKCIITFRNVKCQFSNADHQNDAKTQINRDIEVLAWAGVQIHCHCTIDDTKVLLTPESSLKHEQTAISSRDTSFHPCQGERGHVVFSTKPKILFCDLKLVSNESKTLIYQETIPHFAPPSYNGTAVKYFYKLTIGTQRVNAVIQLLRMPIRVLSIMNDTKLSDELINYDFDDPVIGDAVTPANPFLQRDPKESVLDLALHKLDCLTARRSPNSYIITNQYGKVVKFCLLKSTFKLGEDIVGSFNFIDSTVPCVQYSVTLQSEETVVEEHRVRNAKSSMVHTTSYGKCHEFCLNTRFSQMILPLPLTVTPAFQTNIVSLSWKLHFEFVTTKNEDMKSNVIVDAQGMMQQSPAHLNVQTMVWDLPITIYPTHPIQVARGLQMATSSTLTV